MLEGITVLNTYTVHHLTGLFGILLLLSVLFVLIFGVFGKWSALISTLVIVLSICTAALMKAPIFIREEEHYQVLISEEVNFVEFNETYEIVSQEGLIYEIKLREK